MTETKLRTTTELKCVVHEIGRKIDPSTDKSNEHFHNKYLSLPELLRRAYPLLDSKNILMQHIPRVIEGRAVLQVAFFDRLNLLESDPFLVGEMPLEATDPQKKVGEVTYFRRCIPEALFGIKANDDDGETAVGRGSHKDTKPKDPRGPLFSGVTSSTWNTLDDEEMKISKTISKKQIKFMWDLVGQKGEQLFNDALLECTLSGHFKVTDLKTIFGSTVKELSSLGAKKIIDYLVKN
jgi:hypothetical protein